MIELLIEKIIVHEDKIDIYFKTNNTTNPDEPASEVHRDFCLYERKIRITPKGFEASVEL